MLNLYFKVLITWLKLLDLNLEIMQIQGIKEFPDAQDQTHVAAPVSHEAVEVVDDILYGQKGKIVRKKYRFSKLNRDF